MGFLKKLKKRDDRFARIGKMKAAKKDAKAERQFYLEKRNYAEQVYQKTQRSRFMTQLAFLVAIREAFKFGHKRMYETLKKAVLYGECCVQDKMFTVKEARDQLELETGYRVNLDDIKGDFAFQETKRVVDEVTVLYLFALASLYDMGKKRLSRVYEGATDVSGLFAHDSSKVCEKVKEIEDVGIRMRFCGRDAMDMAKEIAKL